jgi:hypothetical protein
MQRDLAFDEAAALATPVQKPARKAPWHLYLIGTLAVLWNIVGVFDFLATATQFQPYMDRFPEGARQYWETQSFMVYAVWAMSVFSALIGSVLLIKRQALAVRVLAAATTTTIFAMALSYSRPAADYDATRVFAVCIIVVSLLILNYAFHQSKRGVLR